MAAIRQTSAGTTWSYRWMSTSRKRAKSLHGTPGCASRVAADKRLAASPIISKFRTTASCVLVSARNLVPPIPRCRRGCGRPPPKRARRVACRRPGQSSDRHRLAEDIVPDDPVQRLLLHDLNAHAHEPRQFLGEIKPGEYRRVGFESDQEVEVAPGAFVAAGDGAEDADVVGAMSARDGEDFFSVLLQQPPDAAGGGSRGGTTGSHDVGVRSDRVYVPRALVSGVGSRRPSAARPSRRDVALDSQTKLAMRCGDHGFWAFAARLETR